MSFRHGLFPLDFQKGVNHFENTPSPLSRFRENEESDSRKIETVQILYVFTFLANVTLADAVKWVESTGISLLQAE